MREDERSRYGVQLLWPADDPGPVVAYHPSDVNIWFDDETRCAREAGRLNSGAP